MKTLIVNAHPDFANPNHYSMKLLAAFKKMYATNWPLEHLTTLNLYQEAIPRIKEGELQSIWQKQATGKQLTLAEEQIANQSQALLNQFKQHQRIVIATPLHNFNIPSALKDYLDNILIAQETFRYLDTPMENGKASQGLMVADHRMLLLYASGSVYTQNDFYRELDFAPAYLKAMFQEVMGFSQVQLVRAEGTAYLEEAAILSRADAQLQEALTAFYDKALIPK